MDTRSNIQKGKIENAYLFFGEEDYKKKIFKNLLKSKVPYGDSVNLSQFDGKDLNYSELYEIAMTLPFFAEKRLIIVENTNKFQQRKKKDDAKNKNSDAETNQNDDGGYEVKAFDEEKEERAEKEILKILEELPKTTCIAFFESKAAKNKKIFKKIAEIGVCEPCEKDSDSEIIKWIQKGFKSFGIYCDSKTASFLLERVGSDYTMLSQEVKKIASFVTGKEKVEQKDIEAISHESIESKIFNMLDAMCDKNQKLVLDKYFDMLQNKEEPLMILAMIRRQFRIMLQVAELSNKGYSENELFKEFKIQSFVVQKMKNYLTKYFKMKDVINALEKINETDKAIKSGNLNSQIGVEMLLIELSS